MNDSQNTVIHCYCAGVPEETAEYEMLLELIFKKADAIYFVTSLINLVKKQIWMSLHKGTEAFSLCVTTRYEGA